MKVSVWDLFVRTFHWSLVTLFAANALFVDDDGKLHLWIGYAIVVLVVLRIIWGFIGSPYARFSSFPPSIKDSFDQVQEVFQRRVTVHKGHTPLGALMIYNLIISMLGIGLSGYLMTTDTFWGVEWPGIMHEVFVYWAEFCVLVHIAAVLFESLRTRVNLPLSMITGNKKIPQDDGVDK